MPEQQHLLTMSDVAHVETVCLTGGDTVAFTAQAMLVVLRSYRQAVSALTKASPDNEFLKVIGVKHEPWRES